MRAFASVVTCFVVLATLLALGHPVVAGYGLVALTAVWAVKVGGWF